MKIKNNGRNGRNSFHRVEATITLYKDDLYCQAQSFGSVATFRTVYFGSVILIKARPGFWAQKGGESGSV